MKILHLCLACFYIDNYLYQENMLPKYHKDMGYDVEIIASTLSFDKNGNGCNIESGIYNNEYGIKVTRLNYAKWSGTKIGKLLRVYDKTYEAIKKARPDIIFIHGCQFCDIKLVVKYVKKHGCKVYVDNHADFSNSATNVISKIFLHKLLWRYCAYLIEPFTTKFYGVLPARVEFLKKVYKLPAEKCELLVMGADDELVREANCDEVRKNVRNKYGILSNDFLIVTGGKIDKWKMQTFLLMEAVKNIKSDKLKLIVFGSIADELKERMFKLIDGLRIQYIGWIDSQNSYKIFSASDLVVFPGRHSVMWEQVVAQGIPMFVKKWDGTTHVDLGGNVKFITNDSIEEIQNMIEEVLNDNKLYLSMKKVASEKGMKMFSYSKIAERSIL